MSLSVADRVASLIEYIQSGKILDAMTEFYHDDVAMQENGKSPTKGLEANIEREKQFLSQVADFHGFGASAIGIEGGGGGTGAALVENWMEFTNTAGQKIRLEQVSVQKWENGKIRSERFYFDSAS